MKLRILTPTLLVSLLLVQPLAGDHTFAQRAKRTKQARSQIQTWYVFVSPEGDFTLSFPRKPSREADEPGPNSPVKSYGLYTQNGMRFSVNSQAGSGDPNSPLANEWNDRYEQSLLSSYRENKRRVIHSQRIAKNGFEAEIWDSSADNGESINYVIQTILRRGRIYTLLCGSEVYGQKVSKSICRKFFSSMQFIEDTAARSTR
jgi:hypothetical protein